MPSASVRRVSAAAVRTPAEFETASAVPLRALGGGARGPGRREGDLGAGGDRRALRRSLQPRAARRAARGRGGRGGRRARAALPAAQDLRGRARSRPSSPSARTSSRTGCSPRGSRSTARRCRCAPRRRSSPCCRRTPTARSSARSRPTRAPRFNDDRLELLAAAEELSAELSGDRRPGRAQRGGEGDLAARARPASCRRRATPSTASYAALREPLVRAAARPGARRDPVELPHRVHAPALAARGDLHEGARDRGLPRDADASSASTSPPTTNIKLDLDDRPQKSPRACVIASDPPSVVHLITRAQGGLHDYQAFLHEAGPRAALRRLSTRRCRTRSAASRATTR